MVKILLVEDEKPIQEMIEFTLSMRKMHVDCVSNLADALFFLKSHDIDCIIIDWMLPDKSGIELVRKIRLDKNITDLPIIMLTAKSTEKNKLIGFEAGVDDYITKPFSPRELVVRINALLKRSSRYKNINNKSMLSNKSSDLLVCDDLVIDCIKHEVLVADKLISLGPTEYKLLVYLLRNKNKVCSREVLMEKVWSGKDTLTDRTVDVHIRRVRKALEGTGIEKKINTIRSFGYIFK